MQSVEPRHHPRPLPARLRGRDRVEATVYFAQQTEHLLVSMAAFPHRCARTRLSAWWRARRRRLLQLWGAGLIASVLVTGASALGYLEPLQARTLDVLMRLGGQRFPSEVVIVALDDTAFDALGRRQPIPRDYLARLVRGLQRSGAAAAGLDITLGTATTAAADMALARALLDWSQDGVSRVVFVGTTPPDSGPLADPAFLRSMMRGSDRVPVDADGIIRRAAVLIPSGVGRSLPALSLVTLAQVGGGRRDALETTLAESGAVATLPMWSPRAGWDVTAPAPRDIRPGQLLRINFVGPQGSFLTIPSDAVANLGGGEAMIAEDNPLRGRIALVGATFRDSRDFFETPQGTLPGVEVHANLVHMLATRSFIRPSGWLVSLAIQLGVVGVAGVIFVLLRPLRGTLVSLALTLALGVPASYLAFHGGGYAVDFLIPVLVTCTLGVTAEGLARHRFRSSFGRYVGREVMKQVVAEHPSLEGDRREVSILISDLRGFTTLSETMPVETVATRLNEYFPAMIGAIFAHRGMISAFLGDGILAVFGAPLHDPDHAWHAARAAVAMQAALAELNRGWAASGLPALRMGIGIHTGVVFAGNVGGAARTTYTVIGDPVNVTARLESLNKDLGTTLLITEEAQTRLGDRVETRYCGEAPVKGRAQPLRVYELLAVHPDGGLPESKGISKEGGR